MVWIVIVTGVAVVVALVFLAKPLMRAVLNRVMDDVVKTLFTEPYTKSMWEGMLALRRFGVQWVMENEMRSNATVPLEKPIGTHRHFPHFDGLLFNTAQLHHKPIDHTFAINLTTVIGKRASRPMIVSMPIMTTAMGYGVALSKPFVHALAKGTAKAGTAFNAGQGPVLPEYRSMAHRLTLQYHGGPWKPTDDMIAQADMIEIRYGQGANGGCGTVVAGNTLTSEIAKDMGQPGVKPTDALYIPVGIPGVAKPRDLRNLVDRLRKVSRGAPIALKLAAGNDLEYDLEIAIRAGVDVVVIDGAQGGVHAAPAILVDEFGIPTLAALCRAVRFVSTYGTKDQVDIVISGGFHTPGDILKAIALGATAVNIGNAALFATMHEQITKVLPFEPPTQLAWGLGNASDQFDENQGATSLANFLMSSAEELRVGVRALGKTSLSDLSIQDLVAWDADVARITGVPLT